MRTFARLLAVGGMTLAGLGLLAAPASAHVTVGPETATQGGFATLTFKVPNERDDASTTALEVQLPEDQPLAFVSVQPKPGWEIDVDTEELDSPVEGEDGEITERVSDITWTAAAEGSPIDPGEFDTFLISAGQLPADDQMVFKALQTYSDGEVVRWIEEGAEGSEVEPELPAPVLALVAEQESGGGSGGGSTDGTSAEIAELKATAEEAKEAALEAQTAASELADGPSSSQVNTAVGLAIGAIVLALIAGGLGGAALARRGDGEASNPPPAF